jgi:hypothetical protein
MRLYEITNRNKSYTFDLDSIDVLVLGDGSVPVEQANSVRVHCGNYDFTLLFNNASEAMSTYEHIKLSMQPPRR